MTKKKRFARLKSLMPRKRGERRRVELLGGAAFALLAALVVCIFVASSIDRYFLATRQYAAVIAAVLVDLANGDRAGQSLGALTINPVLVAAAQAKANDMAKYSYFAHVSPQGVDPWHWFQAAGYAFDYAGENLAVDFNDSSDVNAAWMNSPTHRENILDPHFTQIGIATAQGTYQGHPTTFVVQEFGTPSGASAAAAIRETNIPTNPTQPALATTQPGTNVLGETQTPPAPAPAPKPIPKPIAATPAPANVAILGTSAQTPAPTPALIAEVPAPDYAPWWAHLAASPHKALQYAYYLLALMILAALAAATGMEIRLHHMRKAATAGALLFFIGVMFVAANTFIFTAPTLTQNASQAAAAGLSF